MSGLRFALRISSAIGVLPLEAVPFKGMAPFRLGGMNMFGDEIRMDPILGV
jgi:hypothetical protein